MTADNVIDGQFDTQGWNRFSYVKGNPVRYKDPTGHQTKEYTIENRSEVYNNNTYNKVYKSDTTLNQRPSGRGKSGGIMQIVNATSQIAKDIDQANATQANEKQALTNVVINVLRSKIRGNKLSNISKDSIIKAALEYKFPPKETQGAVLSNSNNSILPSLFQKPAYKSPYSSVTEMVGLDKPDLKSKSKNAQENINHIKDLVDAFFKSDKALDKYYDKKHKVLDRWSPVNEEQLKILKNTRKEFLYRENQDMKLEKTG